MSHLLTLYSLFEVKMWEVRTGRLDTRRAEGPPRQSAPLAAHADLLCVGALRPAPGQLSLRTVFRVTREVLGVKKLKVGSQ